MKTNTALSGAAIAAVLLVSGCATTNEGASGNAAPPAVSQAPATTLKDGIPAPGAPTPESAPPRWVQPNETRAPETERPVPTATTAPPTTAITAKPKASATMPPKKAPSATVAPKTTAGTPTPTRTTAAPQMTTQRPTTAAPPTPRGNTIRIGDWSHGYVSAYGSQASLDACNLVEWSPLWFAGHNYCGYQFWAALGTGQRIVLTGRNAGTYTVTATVYLPYQGGQKPALPAHDLALQTCKGSGTQIVLATKTG